MPEILTESFCERCGTRYTFESAVPTKTKKLGRFKTLSKGLKNYVLSDDTSLDEAMAEARSDEERQLTAQQLDAFHATFNFCMTCRQYTCGNCWNEIEGSCLTCAPHLGHEIMPAPFPPFAPFEPAPIPEPERVEEAWPTADLRVAADPETNGHLDVEEIDLAARLSQVTLGARTQQPVEPVFDQTASLDSKVADEELASVDAVLDPVALVEPDTFVEPEKVAEPAAEAPVVHLPMAVAPPLPDEDDVDGRAAAAAARTSALLGRFRPGQNLDAELAAYEASLAKAESITAQVEPEPIAADAAPQPEPEPVAAEVQPEPIAAQVAPQPEPVAAQAEPEAEPEPVAAVVEAEPIAAQVEPEAIAAQAEPEPVTAQVGPEPEPVAAQAEPEPAAAQPEPVTAQVGPEPEPVAAQAEPEPIATAAPVQPRVDRVEQPTWRIVAPDISAPAPSGREQVDPGLAASTTPGPAAEPEWPTTPQWPTAAPAIPFLDKVTDRSTAALWAASARDVVSAPGAAPTAGVQPCSSCGLSLSATARFCRRCGSRQNG